MLDEMELESWERADLIEARKVICDGCTSKFIFEPLQLDPSKFNEMSSVGKIRFLTQAINFLDADIYIGAWPYVLYEFEGKKVNYFPVFDVPREGRRNDPRIINNGSWKKEPWYFLSRNELTLNNYCRLLWLKDVIKMADKYQWCFKADLKKAFHQIWTSRNQWHRNAIVIPPEKGVPNDTPLTFIDVTSPMGLSNSPRNFNLVVFAFVLSLVHFHPDHFAKGRKKKIGSFFDDFFGWAKSEGAASRMLNIMLDWGRFLGLKWHRDKIDLPSHIQKLLGFIFDHKNRMITIPKVKLEKMQLKLNKAISLNGEILKKDFQSNQGLWNWFRAAIPESWAYCSSMNLAMKSLKDGEKFFPAKNPGLAARLVSDLKTLRSFIQDDHGNLRSPEISFDWLLKELPYSEKQAFSDASGNWGMGGWIPGFAWQLSYEQLAVRLGRSLDEIRNWHINEKELIAACITLDLFVRRTELKGRCVVFNIDNTVAQSWLGKGRSGKPFFDTLVAFAIRAQIENNVKVIFRYIKSKDNVVADLLSREHCETVTIPIRRTDSKLRKPVRVTLPNLAKVKTLIPRTRCFIPLKVRQSRRNTGSTASRTAQTNSNPKNWSHSSIWQQ